MPTIGEIILIIASMLVGGCWTLAGLMLAVLAPRNGPIVAAYLHRKIDHLSEQREEWKRARGTDG